MLGCQDFCGYYEWTFHFFREQFGEAALQALWASAIGLDAQKHYLALGADHGLRGLYDAWKHTGEEEQCDWTFTLDEKSQVLRWDMRKCPSKGFLLDNDLGADEDYCDHCIGWESSMLSALGLKMIRHEHNHSGQCWGEMSPAGDSPPQLELPVDIRRDPRWNTGYIERFSDHVKLPVLGQPGGTNDWVAALRAIVTGKPRVVALGRGPSLASLPASVHPNSRLLVTASAYAAGESWWVTPDLILVNSPPDDHLLSALSRRFQLEPPAKRPTLAYAFLPSVEPVPFESFGLPRPIPILPALIRMGLYTHVPNGPYPTTGVFLALLAAAVAPDNVQIHLAGIDGYAHPSGHIYAHAPPTSDSSWPACHSPDADTAALARLSAHLGPRLHLHT